MNRQPDRLPPGGGGGGGREEEACSSETIPARRFRRSREKRENKNDVQLPLSGREENTYNKNAEEKQHRCVLTRAIILAISRTLRLVSYPANAMNGARARTTRTTFVYRATAPPSPLSLCKNSYNTFCCALRRF